MSYGKIYDTTWWGNPQKDGWGGVYYNLASPELLLDTYPNAAAAYSLRRLNSNYTGDAIRVRRASDNTEQNIGFVNNELDTASLTTFCSGTDGFVTTWYDQSGGLNNATQTTASSQPKIYDSVTGVILENGKPAVDFDGVDDSMTNNTSLLGGLNTLSFISAAYWRLSNFGRLYTETDGLSNIDRFEIKRDGLNPRIDYLVGIRVQTTNTYLTNNNQHLVSVYRDGLNGGNAYIDNNLDAIIPSSTDTINIQNGVIGTDIDGGAWFNGSIHEIIIYPTDQSTNRTPIETNINDFYNIY